MRTGTTLSCVVARAKSYEMTLPVTIRVYYDGSIIREELYSVQKYFHNKLADTGASDFKTYEPIYRAALDYGAQAQLYFNGRRYGDNQTYNTHIDNLANAQSNPGNDISSIGAVPEPAVPAAVTDRLDCVSKVSASLVLDSTTTIRCKITDPLCHDAAAFEEKYDFSVDGDDMRCSYLGDNTYAIELPGLAASELSHPYTFSVTAGGKTMKIRYSGLAYAYNTYTKSADSKLRALCLTLYAYAKAAATIWPEA